MSSSPPSGAPRRAPVEPGTLYVVGTPIGNLEDMTYRAVRVLGEVDLIAAEDTRSARVLLEHYQITTRTMSYFKGNEARREAVLLEHLRGGSAVGLISEAGMPGVADPGGRLIESCLGHGIAVDVIPGPSAAVTALVLSGLPSARFSFLGFLPRGSKPRRQLLEQLKGEPGTMVIFEAPPRVAKTLKQLHEALGPRRAAVVREMTKMYQEVAPGTLEELAARYQDSAPRGEVTLVVAGEDSPLEISETELQGEVSRRLARGESPRQIANALATLGRRRVYQLALALS